MVQILKLRISNVITVTCLHVNENKNTRYLNNLLKKKKRYCPFLSWLPGTIQNSRLNASTEIFFVNCNVKTLKSKLEWLSVIKLEKPSRGFYLINI